MKRVFLFSVLTMSFFVANCGELTDGAQKVKEAFDDAFDYLDNLPVFYKENMRKKLVSLYQQVESREGRIRNLNTGYKDEKRTNKALKQENEALMKEVERLNKEIQDLSQKLNKAYSVPRTGIAN